MSRYSIELKQLHQGKNRRLDGVFGWDEPMQTWFYASDLETDDENVTSEVWIGTRYAEILTLDDLLKRFEQLKITILNSKFNNMSLKEAREEDKKNRDI